MQTEKSNDFSPPEGLLEAAIYTRDLQRARKFYGDVIGLEEIYFSENNSVFFRCGDTVLLIFNPDDTIKQPFPNAKLAIPGHGATGAGHICFRAPGKRLDRWKNRLIEQGVEIESEITWQNGARSIYFRDPAGNCLEFAQPKIWGYPEKPEMEEQE